MMVLFSMKAPTVALSDSSSGGEPETSTTSATWPSSRARSTRVVRPVSSTMPE